MKKKKSQVLAFKHMNSVGRVAYLPICLLPLLPKFSEFSGVIEGNKIFQVVQLSF
jgi:hypothetical protein